MALVLSTPFVDVLVIGGGVRWFAAYGVVVAIGLSAAAIAIAMAIVLFRLIGASRTRLVAQILAAIIGAGFVIALQIAAIVSYGTLSRFAVLTSDAAAALRLIRQHRLVAGTRGARRRRSAAASIAVGLGLLGAVMAIFSPRFADTAVSVRRMQPRPIAATAPERFVPVPGNRRCDGRNSCCCGATRGWCRNPDATALSSAAGADAVAEFCRPFHRHCTDHPGRCHGGGPACGGLAWLTISGEDAADLVTTAPLPSSRVTRAKIEVVLIAIGMLFAPLIIALAFASPPQAALTALGIAVAAASATAIQLWFRVQAKRSQFRRRQTSSRLATFAEAFSSIGWAATAALR